VKLQAQEWFFCNNWDGAKMQRVFCLLCILFSASNFTRILEDRGERQTWANPFFSFCSGCSCMLNSKEWLIHIQSLELAWRCCLRTNGKCSPTLDIRCTNVSPLCAFGDFLSQLGSFVIDWLICFQWPWKLGFCWCEPWSSLSELIGDGCRLDCFTVSFFLWQTKRSCFLKKWF